MRCTEMMNSHMKPNYQDAVDPAEIHALEAQWGALPLHRRQLTVDHPFLTGEHQLLVSDERRAEICYIMHRGKVDEGVLLHVKTFYPSGAYRLPTGGIHQGEPVMETLAREIEEETGLQVGTGAEDVQVQHCLGIVLYEMDHHSTGRSFPFATYHFLVQMPPGGVIAPRDATEQIGGWQWRRPDELIAVAEYLEQIGNRQPLWGDWGRFRSLSHRFVASRLQTNL
jgi:8-oxo-dGTP pyrophosphatase MutT (NUDIX family)